MLLALVLAIVDGFCSTIFVSFHFLCIYVALLLVGHSLRNITLGEILDCLTAIVIFVVGLSSNLTEFKNVGCVHPGNLLF